MVAGGFARDCPRQSRGNYSALERQAVVNVAGGFDLPPECVEDQPPPPERLRSQSKWRNCIPPPIAPPKPHEMPIKIPDDLPPSPLWSPKASS